MRVWSVGLAVGIAIGTSSLAGSARADEVEGKHRFGDRGFIVSADRLLPLLSYDSIKVSSDGSSETQSRFSLALTNSGPYGVFSSFYNLPRVSFDWLPVRNLTIGASTWLYMDLSANQTISPAGGSSTTSDQPKVTYWGVAPRVGYVIPFGDKLYFWPRAGVEYYDVSTSNVGNGSGSIQEFAIDVEAMLVVSPWTHFGFTVGPTVDIPISGEQTTTAAIPTGTTMATTTTTTSRLDSTMFQVGLSAGMLGHF
ncbi:MAG TPA: hypothetical protein VGL81_02240 [Polyangiaceae bacterium]|jgi:hypothetical protein